MATKILTAVLVVLLLLGGYAWWKQHYGSSALGSGDVSGIAPSDKQKMDTGATVDPTTGEAAKPTPSRSDAPGTLNGDATKEPSANQPGAGQYGPTGRLERTGGSTEPPRRDSISPNPPNGAIFTGDGAYQWYRQGNITWRVDSHTGAYCIAFATLEEWQKPIVYQNGCGSGRG